MNKLAIITAFLGGIRNRYMQYQPDRSLAEKLALAGTIEGCDGVELCYPADFDDFGQLKDLLDQHQLGVSAINFRSRREGKWWRGSFISEHAHERQEVVDDLKRAMDYAAALGCNRITTCPLNEGSDVPLELDYGRAHDHAIQTFRAVCAHNHEVRICIEYKKSDPMARTLFASAAETATFCLLSGADNLGATFDIGHSLIAEERPAQAAVLLHRANRLFYVHLNDNDGRWDWDMLPGAYHIWEFVELFYTLRQLGYEDDWYAFDVFIKEHEPVESFNAAMSLTRTLEAITNRLDVEIVETLLNDRNPARTLTYLYSLL